MIGQVIFETPGLIPSITDYMVFTASRNLSGMDFAFVANGHLYHTSKDTEDRIPGGSIQHAGDNILALARHLVKESDDLVVTDKEETVQYVFFDVMGLFLVCYPAWVQIAINAVVIGMSLLVAVTKPVVCDHEVNRVVYWKNFVVCLVVQGAAISVVLLVNAAIYIIITNSGENKLSTTYLVEFRTLSHNTPIFIFRQSSVVGFEAIFVGHVRGSSSYVTVGSCGLSFAPLAEMFETANVTYAHRVDPL